MSRREGESEQKGGNGRGSVKHTTAAHMGGLRRSVGRSNGLAKSSANKNITSNIQKKKAPHANASKQKQRR